MCSPVKKKINFGFLKGNLQIKKHLLWSKDNEVFSFYSFILLVFKTLEHPGAEPYKPRGTSVTPWKIKNQ
jgi:hypothetical protein